MDLHRLSSELLRGLRGGRSQVAFSRRLGYRSNVAATWESGRRWPTASKVLWAAGRVGVDVEAGLRRFYKVQPSFLDEEELQTRAGIAALLRDLRRDLPVTEVARRGGFSRFQVARWLSGQAEPRLPELLGLVDATTGRLLDFVAVLIDPALLPIAADAWTQLEAARSLFLRMPHAQLVLLGLELAAYRALPDHDDAWLAARMQLEPAEVEQAVAELLRTGQIRRAGTALEPADVQTVDTRRHPHAGHALRLWWADRARAGIDGPDTSWSFNAFTVSEADLKRIIELYRTTYRAMRAIAAASSPAERVVLVQQGVVPLDVEGGR